MNIYIYFVYASGPIFGTSAEVTFQKVAFWFREISPWFSCLRALQGIPDLRNDPGGSEVVGSVFSSWIHGVIGRDFHYKRSHVFVKCHGNLRYPPKATPPNK